MLKIKLQQLKNKAKNFYGKHKRGIFIGGTIGAVCIGKILFNRHIYNECEQAYKAGSRITGLTYNTAASNVVGIEKTNEIIEKRNEISTKLCNQLAKLKMTPKEFNTLYDNGMLNTTSISDEMNKLK